MYCSIGFVFNDFLKSLDYNFNINFGLKTWEFVDFDFSFAIIINTFPKKTFISNVILKGKWPGLYDLGI